MGRIPLGFAVSLIPTGLVTLLVGLVNGRQNPALAVGLIMVGLLCFGVFLFWLLMVLGGDFDVNDPDLPMP